MGGGGRAVAVAGRGRAGLLQLHLQEAGARAEAARPPAAAAAAQRDLPHLQVRARLLGVLLPQRRHLLHGRHLGQPHLQLRVPQRLRRAAVRVQGPRRLVRAHQPAADDGDGVDRGRGHGGRVPGDSSLLRRVGAAAAARQGAVVAAGRARRRARAAGGRAGAPRARGRPLQALPRARPAALADSPCTYG